MSRPILRAEKRNERGVTILLWTITLPILISLMGLGVDASVMYAVKARLQLASDGAALAAARSLTLGATTEAQTDAATANATRWFKMNYGAGYFGSANVSDPTVVVNEDPGNTSIRNVQVVAGVDSPTYFMRFWSIDSTRLRSASKASRRDVVAMLVLDRSGSMGGTPCTRMKEGAKLFTGAFANGRDRIGMVTYNDTAFLASSPVLDFEPILGFNEGGVGGRTGTGQIDLIGCNGWTASPQALAIGYNELFKQQLPGALNVIVFFTDGIPNTMTMDFSNKVGVSTYEAASTCLDAQSPTRRSVVSGLSDFLNFPPQWFAGKNWGAYSYLPNIPAGPIGALTSEGGTYDGVKSFLTTASNGSSSRYSNATTGCLYSNNGGNYRPDFTHYPATDVYGNKLVGVQSGFTDFGTINTQTVAGELRVNEDSLAWAAYNATWSAGVIARTPRNMSNGTACVLPNPACFTGATIYAIGLGSGAKHDLLLATANDDTSPTVPAPASPNNTRYDSASVKGEYIWTNDANTLPNEFKKIAAMILRLSN